MKTRYSQRGISMFGILAMASLFAFFLTVTLRLAPAYMEGRKVASVITQVAKNSDSSMSLREVSKRVQSAFVTNMIEGIKEKQVKVTREKNTIVIDASYEARVTLFKGVDVVLVFDDIKQTIN